MADEHKDDNDKEEEYGVQDAIGDIVDFIEEGRAFVFLCIDREGHWSIRSSVGELEKVEPFCLDVIRAAKIERDQNGDPQQPR